MNFRFYPLALMLLALATTYGQELVNGNRDFRGTVKAGNAVSTQPIKVGTLASIPATCAVGEMYYASDVTTSRKLYQCTATNTWARLMYESGSADPGTCTVSDLFFNTTTNKLKVCVATNTWEYSGGISTFGVGWSGSALVLNAVKTVIIPYSCTLSKWWISSDVSGGTFTVDILRSAASIVGAGNAATISSGAVAGPTNISSWTSNAITAGDVLTFKVTSATGTLTYGDVVYYCAQ